MTSGFDDAGGVGHDAPPLRGLSNSESARTAQRLRVRGRLAPFRRQGPRRTCHPRGFAGRTRPSWAGLVEAAAFRPSSPHAEDVCRGLETARAIAMERPPSYAVLRAATPGGTRPDPRYESLTSGRTDSKATRPWRAGPSLRRNFRMGTRVCSRDTLRSGDPRCAPGTRAYTPDARLRETGVVPQHPLALVDRRTCSELRPQPQPARFVRDFDRSAAAPDCLGELRAERSARGEKAQRRGLVKEAVAPESSGSPRR